MSTRLGIRRHCQSCSVKYYDLNKTKIICPSCNTVFDPEVRLKSRRIKVAPTPVVAKPATGDDSIADPDMIAPDFDGDGDSEDSSGLLDEDAQLVQGAEKKEDIDGETEQHTIEANFLDSDEAE